MEFAILTAARSGEVLGARWEEIDFETKVWTVPAEHMKGGRDHRVPLPERAMAILVELHEARVSDFVFPGFKRGRPLSDGALEGVLRRVKVDCTVHGFRSSFRDWAGDSTAFACDVVEAAPRTDGGMGRLLQFGSKRTAGQRHAAAADALINFPVVAGELTRGAGNRRN